MGQNVPPYLFLRKLFIPLVLVFANFQFSPVTPVIDTAINAGHADSNTWSETFQSGQLQITLSTYEYQKGYAIADGPVQTLSHKESKRCSTSRKSIDTPF